MTPLSTVFAGAGGWDVCARDGAGQRSSSNRPVEEALVADCMSASCASDYRTTSTRPRHVPLPQPRLAPHRFDQLDGIEADALLEDDLDIPHVGDVRRRIAVQRPRDRPACQRQSCRRARRARDTSRRSAVPILIASSGVKPASTSSSSWRWLE